MDMIEADREAARHIWFHWGKPTYIQPEDPLVPEFASHSDKVLLMLFNNNSIPFG
jgi:hypothetical protein